MPIIKLGRLLRDTKHRQKKRVRAKRSEGGRRREKGCLDWCRLIQFPACGDISGPQGPLCLHRSKEGKDGDRLGIGGGALTNLRCAFQQWRVLMFNLYPKSLLKDTPNWLEIETERKRAYLQTFGARQPTNTQTHTQTQRVSERTQVFYSPASISQGKRGDHGVFNSLWHLHRVQF